MIIKKIGISLNSKFTNKETAEDAKKKFLHITVIPTNKSLICRLSLWFIIGRTNKQV